MGKVVTIRAEYDADQNSLQLAVPLEGVANREQVTVQVTTSKPADDQNPWLPFSGILSKEAGDELSQLVNEMFPPWND
jgi:hypothetical protein